MSPSQTRFPGRLCRQLRALRLLALTIIVLGFVTRAYPANDPPVTDQNVDTAITSAVAWLYAQRNAEGHWEEQNNPKDLHWAGSSALAVLALLYAGENPYQDALAESIDWLTAQTLNGTYTHGIRAHVLALVPGDKHKKHLRDDLNWLLDNVWPEASEHPGCYGYEPLTRVEPRGYWDNSNTQYGVLGVWMAAEAGQKVPDAYWDLIGKHWIACQAGDGGWNYRGFANERSTASMTAAGLASLFVVLDQRYAGRNRGAEFTLTAIERGLDWLGHNYSAENTGGDQQYRFYYLYGVERVARASGYKYFRNKDWFREGAAYLLATQQPDGRWRGSGGGMTEVRNTAFALMFLCHGRAPLLLSKLQYDGAWNSHQRDAARLAQYVSQAYERLLNWQIVRLDGPLDDLTEAPVLYLYGESELKLDRDTIEKIRAYCERGGLLFGVAGEDSSDFCRGFESIARQAFPAYPTRRLPSDHPLFSGDVGFEIADPPAFVEVHNGVRTLMLLSTRDVAKSWDRASYTTATRPDVQLAANVYSYATDKSRIRSRLQTSAIVMRDTAVKRTIRIARIRYNGTWDPEPYGWTRLRAYLRNHTATDLDVVEGVALDSASLSDFRVAHITGLTTLRLSPAEMQGLRQFLNGGGTLIADAAGGGEEFYKSLEAVLREVLHQEPESLPPTAFLLTGTGIEDAADLAGMTYRRRAHTAAGGRSYPRLVAFGSRRRFNAICSPLDITAGLLGTEVYDVMGYAPDSALRIMRNLILYADLSSAEKARLHRGD